MVDRVQIKKVIVYTKPPNRDNLLKNQFQICQLHYICLKELWKLLKINILLFKTEIPGTTT